MAQSTMGLQIGEVSDNNWLRQALFVPGNISKRANSRSRDILKSQQFSENSLNFADTSLGGNRSINPRPQFTKNADPNIDSLLAADGSNKTSSLGMGRYYGEAVDTNAQRIFMQFGVPAFNSLTNFFTSYYDRGQGQLANTGKVSSILYSIGKYVGYIVLWPVVAVLGVTAFLYKVAADLAGKPLSKFYYMKPTMPLYWTTVTTIVNAISVNMGLAQGVDNEDFKREPGKEPGAFGTTPADIEALNRLLPDIMRNSNGGIDIRAVANRYQRLSNIHDRKFAAILEDSANEAEAKEKIIKYLNRKASTYNASGQHFTMEEYIDSYIGSASGRGDFLDDKLNEDIPAGVDNSAVPQRRANLAAGVNNISNTRTNIDGADVSLSEHLNKYKEHALAELRDGSAFISFIVDHQDTISESFSNSTKSSDIASSMNETSSSARNKIFDFAGGNIGDGLIAGTIEGIIGGVGDILGGLASSVKLDGLSALGGKAFVDMPEFWESSSTTLPTNSYNIQLRSPYGNSVSIMNNIMVPLATLLAGVVPRSTGRNSYTGPFLCKLWSKGRSQIQLGMVTSMTITRGAGNVGWNIKDQSVGIDVSFSITNLSKILHMPISNEVSVFDALGLSMFDEDNNMTDYMAVLGSLGLSEQHYNSGKWRLRRARARQQFDSWLSVTNFAQWSVNTLPGSMIAGFSRTANI